MWPGNCSLHIYIRTYAPTVHTAGIVLTYIRTSYVRTVCTSRPSILVDMSGASASTWCLFALAGGGGGAWRKSASVISPAVHTYLPVRASIGKRRLTLS